LTEYAGDDIAKVMIGARADLEKQKDVSLDEASKVAEKFSIDVFETSAKTGEGVNEVLLSLLAHAITPFIIIFLSTFFLILHVKTFRKIRRDRRVPRCSCQLMLNTLVSRRL